MATDGVFLKYGPIKGADACVMVPRGMGASEVIVAQSGRFVKEDASGRLEIAGDGNAALAGWVEAAAQTCSATEGGTVVNLIPAANCPAVFRIPVNSGTFTAAMRGKSCDLSVSSNVQGAQLDASTEDTIIIVDGDLVNNAYVDVMINPAKISPTGVV